MFEKQSFPAAFTLDADPAFRFKPATRVENACATGSAAVQMGLNDLAAGSHDLCLWSVPKR
jgi:acetyl-CoA C-acetyltransferase